MGAPKIRLSSAEAELVQNAELILTKNRVLEKTKFLLEDVQDKQLALTAKDTELTRVPPKISRGENYMGLPWLILDYPRFSSGNDLFFIRSMFWWGNFFSSTLQVAGRFGAVQSGSLAAARDRLISYYIGVGEDPWAHHFGSENYRPIGSIPAGSFRDRCFSAQHLKIAKHWPLADWEQAPFHLFESWKLLMELTGQLPRR